MASVPGLAFSHIGIYVADLARMQDFYGRVLGFTITDRGALDTPRSPEGNRIELFIDTPWYVTQPMRIPLDLGLSDKALWAKVAAEARALPGFVPVEEWRDSISRRMKEHPR